MEDLRGFEWRYLWQRCQGDQLHTLHGHSNAIRCLAISRDGRQLASGDDAGKVKLWDVDSRQVITTLAASKARIERVSFSADGTALATSDKNGLAKVWNLRTRKVVWTHEGAYPEGVQLSPAGTLIGVSRKEPNDELGRHQRSAWVFDWASGKEVWHLGPQADFEAFSVDGRMAIVTRRNDPSELWDIETGRLVKAITNFVGAMFPSPDGRRLAAIGMLEHTEFAAVDLLESTPPVWFRLSRGQVSRAAFSPDGALLAGNGFDQTVRLWDVATQRELPPLLGHVEAVTDVAFSPDGQWLASSSMDQTVKFWPAAPRRNAEIITNVSRAVPRLLLSPNGRTLAGHQLNNGARRLWLWDVATHQSTLLSQSPPLVPLFFSTNSRSLFTRGELDSNGVLPLLRWDLTAPTNPPQTVLLDLQSTNGIAGIASSPDGCVCAVSQIGINRISLWNPLTGEAIGQLRPDRGQRIGEPVVFSADGTKLASSVWPDQIRLITLAAPNNLPGARLPGGVRRMAFSPGGTVLAVTCEDHAIRVFDTAILQEVAVLSGHQQAVVDVTFSPDGRTLASCSGGGVVKMWNWLARREVATVARIAGDFNTVAFTPDGNTLLAGAWTGQIHLWRVPTLAEIDRQP